MIKIRSASINDAKAIAKVHVDSWRAIYRGHMPDSVLDNLSIEQREQEWHERLSQGVTTWVAEVDKRVVGFASVCPSRDEDADPKAISEISAIYLLQEYWRKGIGQQLCIRIFDE